MTLLFCVLFTTGTELLNKTFIFSQYLLVILQLHWRESESDVALNGYLDSPVVCLHWSESDFTWKLGCNPFWSDVTSDVSLSL